MIFGIILGFLSVVIAALGIIFAISLSKRTDRLIEKEDARAKELIKEMHDSLDKDAERVERMIQEGNERVERMIQEGRRETKEMIEEGRRETRELISYICSLIAADGEKTRELIRTSR